MKKILLATSVALVSFTLLSAQEKSQPALDSYNRCLHAMSFDRRVSYDVCRDYLNNYSNDDAERIQKVRKWVAAYDYAVNYAKALGRFASKDAGHDWFVYEPDLNIDVPEVVENNGSYKIDIIYKYDSPLGAALLKKAEAVYGPQAKFISMIREDPAGWSPELPAEVAPLWSVRGNDNVQITEVITTAAIRYYYDLSIAMRENRPFRDVFKHDFEI